MWYKLGQFILRFRVILLLLLFAATCFMGWQASKVQMGYEFAKSIPIDNSKYKDYLSFKSQFGEDGNMLVIGVKDPEFYKQQHFDAYRQMLATIKNVQGVEGILSVASAVNLTKSDTSETLRATPLFPASINTQPLIDSAKTIFENLVFYRRLLYNPDSNAYLAGISINSRLLASKERTEVVKTITDAVDDYEKATGVQAHESGLPLIRTQVADRIKKEMNYFLFGSLGLAMITLILFFRSFSATVLSMMVVIIGVLFAVGTMVLLGYKISLLTALIPPLIIVIGIPNCIYFLNKFHMSWEEGLKDKTLPANELKTAALLTMVSRMGIVTLFCNIAAAVGFFVFAFTKSPLLKEFGIVAGINIMALFVISLIFIPAVLSYMAPPKAHHTKYLRNRVLERLLVKIEYWVLDRKGLVYGFTAVVLVFSAIGILKLKSVGFIVDDLPKEDKIYVDLKWFEKNFGGVMPLEIVIDTKRKNGVTRNLKTIQKIDELSSYIAGMPQFARPLNLVEGLKFAKQAYYDGDSLSYAVPNEFDLVFLSPYLKGNTGDTSSQLSKIVKTFTDSSKQRARISINMADIGTVALPKMLENLRMKSDSIFNLSVVDGPVDNPNAPVTYKNDSAYNIQFTGSSVTFLEGSRFIINGLKESVMWAFLLIALCMLYLFRSFRILICSLIPNVIPLVVTAGLMGWIGVPLKPSTVLVFSVALGIAIDVTIRFLVNYKQELPEHHNNILATTTATIRHTGISIIYTSLVLVAGFVIFVFSSFGGTKALGWLTSFTLLIATFTNLIFLPVIMLALLRKKKTAPKVNAV
ncbi:MAG: MMPL family transporter [Bacteroidota bacterium]